MMGTIRAILAEIVGLFVDDGALAVALLGWAAGLGVLAARVPAMLPVAGPMLAVGCALILVCNVALTARSP